MGAGPKLLVSYSALLVGRGNAPKTRNNHLNLIKAIVRWLIKNEHIDGKPIDLPVKSVEGRRRYYFRAEEVRSMIEHCEVDEELHEMKDMLVTLVNTGMRIGELRGLIWHDIDFERRRVTIAN